MSYCAQQHQKAWEITEDKVDDDRILSSVKNHLHNMETLVKNVLEKVEVSLSNSTVKKRLHKCKCSGCKPLGTLKNRKTRFDSARKNFSKKTFTF